MAITMATEIMVSRVAMVMVNMVMVITDIMGMVTTQGRNENLVVELL